MDSQFWGIIWNCRADQSHTQSGEVRSVYEIKRQEGWGIFDNKRWRENWIDVAKALGLLMIIVGHVSTNLEEGWRFEWVYGVHVMIFFLMSGYTMKAQPLSKVYISKRYSRLMVPYFVTSLLVMGIDIWNGRILLNDWSISSVTKIIGNDLIRSFFASGTVRVLGTLNISIRNGAIWFFAGSLFFYCSCKAGSLECKENRVSGRAAENSSNDGFSDQGFLLALFSV